MAERRGSTIYYSVERTVAYSDAVIAIAATLLVLDLTTTAIGNVSSDADMWAALGDMWPSFQSFAISFALLSGLWVLHMRQFRDIARVDLTLLWINNARLLFIVLIPFTTSLVDDYSDYLAGRILLPINYFFAVTLGVATWLWACSRDGHLLTDEAKPDAPNQTAGGVAAVICGVITVALSPWIGSWAFLIFVLSGPLTTLLARRRGPPKPDGTASS